MADDTAQVRADFLLRFCDTDALGHVNNALHAEMLEAGRLAVLDRCGLALERSSLLLVVVRVEIDYRRELLWPATVAVSQAISHLGTTSFQIRHRIDAGGMAVAEGMSVAVMIDRDTRRPVALDDALRQALAPRVLAAADACLLAGRRLGRSSDMVASMAGLLQTGSQANSQQELSSR